MVLPKCVSDSCKRILTLQITYMFPLQQRLCSEFCNQPQIVWHLILLCLVSVILFECTAGSAVRQSIHVRPSKRIGRDYDFSRVENGTKKILCQDFPLSVPPHSWKAISAQGKFYWPSRVRKMQVQRKQLSDQHERDILQPEALSNTNKSF